MSNFLHIPSISSAIMPLKRLGLLCLIATLTACQAGKSGVTDNNSTVEASQNKWQQMFVTAQNLLQMGQTKVGMTFLQMAAENGNSNAHYALAQHHAALIDTKDNPNAGSLRLFHLRLAADNGQHEAQNLLADMYYTGTVVQQNTAQAVKYYTAASQGNLADAHYILGTIYANQSEGFYNPNQAVTLWEKSTQQGNPKAKAELGWMKYRGEGTELDINGAVALWQDASRENSVLADWGLGHYMSVHNQQDYAVAAYYLRRAVEGNIPEASHYLAELYRTGQGVNPSDITARKLYRHAAKNTDIAAAKLWFGQFLLEGRGGEKNLSLAVKNLQAAYDLGDNAALIPLAETSLKIGQKPRAILQRYFAQLDKNDPNILNTIMLQAQQYSLNLAEYGFSDSDILKIDKLIAINGDVEKQRQLAQNAADNGDIEDQITWLEQLVLSGDHQAIITLSDLLENRNPNRALMLDQTLNMRNDKEGMFRLGMRYLTGKGVELSINEAFRLLNKAAQHGHHKSAFEAANILHNDKNTTKYMPLILKLYKQASDAGIAEATFRLGTLQLNQDKQELLLTAIKQGSDQAALVYAESHYLNPLMGWDKLEPYYTQNRQHPIAQLRFALHDLYFGTADQAEIALKALQTLSQLNNNPVAQHIALRHLAQLYLTGYQQINLSKNLDQAAELYQELLPLSEAEAYYGLGNVALLRNDLKNAQKQWQQANIPAAIVAQIQHGSTLQQSLLAQSAQQGITEAYHAAAVTITDATKADLSKARAAAYKNSLAWTVWDMAVDAQYGITAAIDLDLARQWYLLASRIGQTKAFTALGQLNVEIDPEKAEFYLNKAIQFNDSDGMVVLGRLIHNRTAEDAQKALSYWQTATKLGNTEAEMFVAWAHDVGIGTAQNPKKAFDIYNRLFKNGHQQAGFNLANMYINGRGVQKDINKGLGIFEQAGNNGDPRAWMELGKLLSRTELDDIHDPNKAAGFLLLAAHSNFAEAWYLLGTLYDEGGSLPVNRKLAYDYYQKAAFLGQSEAQYSLGLGYRYGYGTLKANSYTAYAWLALSARQGDIAASMMRDSILVDFKEGDAEIVQDLIDQLKQQINNAQQR